MIALIMAAAVAAMPDNLIATIGNKARADQLAVAKDQFASASTFKDAIGKPFPIVITEPEQVGFSEHYADGTLWMAISTDVYHDYSGPLVTDRASEMAELMHPPHAIKLFDKTTTLGQHMGQNSYGAQFMVTDLDRDVIDVVGLTMPASDYGTYKVEKALDGPAAKVIFTGAKAVVEGMVATFKDGKVAKCEDSVVEARLSLPFNATFHTCHVAATITRVAIYGGDGTLRQEWK